MKNRTNRDSNFKK